LYRLCGGDPSGSRKKINDERFRDYFSIEK
jgi:hypothetical protein